MYSTMYPDRLLPRALRFLLLGASLLLAGCLSSGGDQRVIQAPPPMIGAPLMVAYSPTGNVLEWQSKAGQTYTILYRDAFPPSSEWRPLPRYRDISGTGAKVRVVDHPPTQQQRKYKLRPAFSGSSTYR